LKGTDLNMWIFTDGTKIFDGNIEDEELAAKAAKECGMFAEDAEDELVSDRPITCLNCRYRRWIAGGFSCQKQ
jgi:hypothetical protein